jgi:hypothetical protein
MDDGEEGRREAVIDEDGLHPLVPADAHRR